MDFATLISPAPAPDAPKELRAFEPLIGSWSLAVENFEPDGSSEHTSAEWHFDWALGGFAVLDVWISPARDAPTREWGLSVRFYDEAIGRFRSTWHGPRRGWVIPFLAEATDTEIRLEGEHEELEVRWTFSEIGANSFRWRAEERAKAGGDWRVRQRFEATRAG